MFRSTDDGNVTLKEYMVFAQVSLEIAEPIFNAYDYDDDGLIPDSFMQDYLHMIDTDGNTFTNISVSPE